MTTSAIVTLSCLGVLAVYDIVMVATGNYNTISRLTWNGCKSKPYIPFLAGFVMGHLFWAGRLGFNICNW